MTTVVLLGTLDTKGREYDYVRGVFRALHIDTILIDVGTRGATSITPDITADEVAGAAGTELQSLRFKHEGPDGRVAALRAMREGAQQVVARLTSEGRCDGIFGLGGSGGSDLISGVMRGLPVGLPKLLVTTLPAAAGEYVGTRDIAIYPAVTDIAGMNRISQHIFGNAAAAMAGMVRFNPELTKQPARPVVAITMFGVTTPAGLAISAELESRGFETVVFHAVGSGGRAMEEMVAEGFIDGVIDLTISEITDEAFGGVFTAGPDRLTAAGRAGLPQVVLPGAIEVLNFGPRASLPSGFDVPERCVIEHNAQVTAVRLNESESQEIGGLLAKKLNQCVGPLAVIWPEQGFDSYMDPGGPYVNPSADAKLLDALRAELRGDIELLMLDAHINAPLSAMTAVETFCRLYSGIGTGIAAP